MNKITPEDFGLFQSESLNVDFIGFNLINLDSNQILKLASYFQTLGFNSYQKNREENKSREELNIDLKNKFELTFILNVPYQKEMIQLQFPGVSGKQFYQLIKQKSIQWEKLTKFDLILSRFDLVYQRTNKSNDKINSKKFINSCFEQFLDYHPHKNLVIEKNKKGLIFKIGNRRSSRYYRLYTKDNGLRFEFEIKYKINDFYKLLLESRFEEFEKILSYQFFKYSFEIFQCSQHPSHIDWLMDRIRPYQYRNKLSERGSINSHYMSQFAEKQSQQKLDLITLLQLLIYVQTLDYQTKMLRSNFRQFKFPLQDFLNYTSKTSNHYQLMKLKKFFNVLSQDLVMECFTDNSYRMLVTIPEAFVYKSEQNIWLAEVWIAQELFEYLHPFLFMDFFNKKLTTDEFQVLFEIVQIFSSSSTRKEFNTQQFLYSYSSNINGTRKKNIKDCFVRHIKVLHEQQKLQNQALLFPSNQTVNIDQLNSIHLGQTLIVFESIDVSFSYNYF